MFLDIFNDVARLFAAGLNLVIFGWMLYWAWRFFVNWRSGKNGITLTLAIFFLSFAIDRVYLMAYSILQVCFSMVLVIAILLTVRLGLLALIIVSLIMLTWEFSSDRDRADCRETEGTHPRPD